MSEEGHKSEFDAEGLSERPKEPLNVNISLEGLSEVTTVISDLKSALEFYATPEAYKSPSRGFAARYDPQPSVIKLDGGSMARNILKKHFKQGE